MIFFLIHSGEKLTFSGNLTCMYNTLVTVSAFHLKKTFFYLVSRFITIYYPVVLVTCL